MNKVIFLDRDGTINVDYGYVHEKEKFELLPEVEDGLLELQKMGYLLIIITNQSGIGRGFFTEKVYLSFQKYIQQFFWEKNINIVSQYYCPHTDENKCQCRKPKIGLFKQAAEDYCVDWEKSFVIGDKERDLKICEIQNIRGFLISNDIGEYEHSRIKVVNSFGEAVKAIVNLNEGYWE